MLSECVIKNVFDKRRLTRSGHAGHDSQQAQGKRNIDLFKIVCESAGDSQRLAVRRSSFRGHFDPSRAANVKSGDRFRILGHVSGRADSDNFPPCAPAPGPRSTT